MTPKKIMQCGNCGRTKKIFVGLHETQMMKDLELRAKNRWCDCGTNAFWVIN